MQLPLTAINQEQIRQHILFIATDQCLTHRRIIIPARNILNRKLAIIALSRTALIKHHTRSNRCFTHSMTDIKAFNSVNGTTNHLFKLMKTLVQFQMITQLAFNRMLHIHLCQLLPFCPRFTHFILNLHLFIKGLLQGLFKLYSVRYIDIHNQLSWHLIRHLKIEVGHKISKHLAQVISQHIRKITFSAQHTPIPHIHDLDAGYACLMGNRQNIGLTLDLKYRLLCLNLT